MQVLYSGYKGNGDTGKDQGGTRIMLLTAPAEIACLLEQLERIAGELSWQPGNQIRTSADQAIHIAAVVGDQVAGGLQVVVNKQVIANKQAVGNEHALGHVEVTMGNGSSCLPCLSVWPEVDVGERPAAHITILALEREYRGHPGLFWPLCVELWRWCHAYGIRTLFLEATPATMRVYQRMGWPLEIVGELRPHWGEDCYLCRTDIRQMEKEISCRASRSVRYRAFLEQAHRK